MSETGSFFRPQVFPSYMEFLKMDQVYKPYDSECYAPPSEPFRVCLTDFFDCLEHSFVRERVRDRGVECCWLEMAVTLLVTRVRSETFWEVMTVTLLMTRMRSETFWEVMGVTLPVIVE
jgi:hypothetical protein